MSDKYERFKKYVTKIAHYELDECEKKDLSEYRSGYTNKYYLNNKQDIFDAHALITKLNNIFSIFSDNIFFGYNIPVDIVIPKTSYIYRDIIDYGLKDSEGNIYLVEIEELDGKVDLFKNQISNWAHYYIPYSYISYKLDKKVTVVTLDPVIYEKVITEYSPDKFELDLKALSSLVEPVMSDYLYKNLYMCNQCEFLGVC